MFNNKLTTGQEKRCRHILNMWVIPLIFISILGISEAKSDLVKLLRRTAREISFEKFDALCSNIGCRPPGGKCDYDAFKKERRIQCTCNKNYTGDLCQHRCSINCGDNGKCVLIVDTKSTKTEKCLCSEGFTGSGCTVKDMGNSNGITERINVIKENRPSSKIQNINVDRECSPQILKYNFPCDLNHGRCVKKTTGYGFIYSCVCKKGWIGTFCHIPCKKKCQNGGFCHVMSSKARAGEQVCICKWDSTGEFCEKPMPFQIFINQRKLIGEKKSTGNAVKLLSSTDKGTIKRGTSNHISRRSINSDWCTRLCGSNSRNCTSMILPFANQIIYICDCKVGWTGPLCQTKCSLACENGGKCVKHNGHEFCSCDIEYRGKFCQKPSQII